MTTYVRNLLSAIVDRFKQESTWRGLIAIATASGIQFNPEYSEAIIATGLFLIGTINFAKNK